MSLLSRLAVQAARAYGILSSKSTNVSASYLVVAGGGGGGASEGSGGGAGGLLTGTSTLSTLNTYTVTVGNGGAGSVAVAVGNLASSGGTSSLAGTGLTTISAAGGGGGAGYNTYGGAAGGSGGGGTPFGVTTGGAGNTPSTTPAQGYAGGNASGSAPQYGAGGGGGSSQVGNNGSSTVGGAGGNGTASSISGSSVTYAGGGGGSTYTTVGTSGSGGSGGGGAGNSAASGTGTAGTANTGGGGGGGGSNANASPGAGGAGGSGIVIISYTSATPKFVGGTLTTSGGNQIHTFTSSGTLSPLTPITASYLVVAGGGAGGSRTASSGGGGGAGGLLTSSTTLYSGATYIVTVGAGGASAANTIGSNGGVSSLAGTGLTTISATGGGGGAGPSPALGAAGGSGGGGGATSPYTGGAGTSGQGYAGGLGSLTSPAYRQGGGGGASMVGYDGGGGTGATVGKGGDGSASSISGTSTYYAGGGGGGSDSGLTSGGLGGGGAGGLNSPATASVAGTTNTGGGGGGMGGSGGNAAAGGSGVVIISYAGSQVFNGGLVTSSGGNTIHTFNATGALTPVTNNLNNSLRFRSSANAYLSRTMNASSTTFTVSCWVKRGALGTYQYIFSSGPNTAANDKGLAYNDTTNTIYIYNGSTQVASTAVYRDPSAWYHVVMSVSSGTAKVYINGNDIGLTHTSMSLGTYGKIGRYNDTNLNQFDGYLADYNFIDGQALEPYYFGNNDAYGNWKPILYKGMYGTNGFYLTFGNTTSTTTLGYDTSGNSNNWTTNNFSLTAGTTYDAMTDVPTNTSATVGNYCVKNPLVASTGATITGANLNSTGSTTAFANARATFTLSSGKWYWEETITGSSIYDIGVGLVLESSVKSASNTRQTGWYNICNAAAGQISSTTNGGAFVNISTTDFATNDVLMIAYDSGTGYIWFGKNGTWYPPTTGGSAGNPAAGTNQTITAVSELIPSSFHYNTNSGTASNFGQRPFTYTPPSGFVALNTYNLPTPTILQGNLYMDATLYTGTEANGTVIVNQGQFKPDLVWIKTRSTTAQHVLTDSVRGVTKQLFSSLTNAEQTSATGITSLNSNGFTLGTNVSPTGSTNGGGNTLVGWQWQAGQSSGSSNTSGTITSTVSANTTAGFSVATFTGTGANATVGHGLGVAPSMIIIKSRSAVTDWATYHASVGNTKALFLNRTLAADTSASYWNNTSPTSTLFTVGTGADVNPSSGTMVAYCWAEIAGFSKFTSYTGNASTDGPFVYTGFRPKYIMVKKSSGIDSWALYDTTRQTYNGGVAMLLAEATDAEYTTTYLVDILSNGFKFRATNGIINASGSTYIYMAFAENPFKNSNAR